MCTALRASRKCSACCCQYHQPSFMVSLAIGPESEQAEEAEALAQLPVLASGAREKFDSHWKRKQG